MSRDVTGGHVEAGTADAGAVVVDDGFVIDVQALAAVLRAARLAGRTLVAPPLGRPLDLPTGYAVQAALTDLRLAAGERIVGLKLGYTSAAMRAQMGVDEPNYGPLTDAMKVPDGGVLPCGLLHPRVEPEVILVMGTQVTGPLDDDAARAAVASAHAGLEIVDSIWRDYQFTLADNTADGSSASGFVVGPELDEALGDGIPVTLRCNGSDVGVGDTSAALGGPLRALQWLAAELGRTGRVLPAGSIVLTGGLTAAVPVRPGQTVVANFAGREVSVMRRKK